MNTKIQVRGQGSRVKGKLKTQNSKLKTFFLLATLNLSLFTVFTGCQQKTAQVKPDEPISQQQKQGVSINNIIFDKSGDTAKVSIEGTGNITYTAFKLSEPFRLVIDIPDADIDKVKESVTVENGIITQITTAHYGKEQAGTKIGRVTIGLKNDADYKIDVQEGKLLVTLNTSASQEVKAQEKKPVPEVLNRGAEPVKPVPEGLNRAKAEKITAIETIKKEKDLTQIMVFADGDIGSYNAFGLDDPSRLVLDIWGVGTAIADKDKEINIGGSHIKKIRLGEHKDKIRLVFESIPKNLPLYSVDVTGAAMTISYGRVEVKKTPLSQIAAVKPETSPNTLENKVSNIDFKPSQAGTRLTITTSKKADYKLSKSLDGKSIVIDFKNVNMPDELKKTADVSTLDTAVASVSSFQMSGEALKGARVLVKLKENALYDVFQDNNNIYLTFPVQTQVAAKGSESVIARSVSDEAISKKEIATPTQALLGYPARNDKMKISSEQTLQKQDKAEGVTPVASIAAGVNAKIEANAAFSEEKGEKKVESPSGSLAGTSASGTGETPVDCKAEMPATYLCKKLSLDFKDADIGNLLRLMAEVSSLNIIADEGVAGKVTLRLVDVPWHQAFDIILKSKGLGKTQEGNIVRIATLTKIKQEDDAALAAKKATEKLGDLVTQIVPVSYAVAKDMEKQIKDVLSDRGKVAIDERTNMLIISDISASIKKAVELVKKLDTQTPQVLIEARIIEAGNNFSRDLGIQWGVDYKTSGNVHTDVFGSVEKSFGQMPHNPAVQNNITKESGGVYPSEKKEWPARAGVTNYAVNLPAAGAFGGLGFVLGKLGINPLILDMRLTAGEQAGMTKIISRPRIATLDNKEAKIQQGEAIPFETTSASGTQTTFIDANLSLTVTPHITADGSIIMKIKVNNNEIGQFRSASGAPSINKKEAITEILVKDGETAVIGGIIKNSKSDGTSGIPLLQDIPILGWLFKSKSVKDIRAELMIFITPTILKEKLAENAAN
ncbi:MAG: type IV pilus secretin PilQ [Deltaproteobacteria bacterium]|nr:type IV pilus secretin PilQ [Deltaproteobacteria bacterium]